MAKATILGSLLGRPSQSYVASDGTYKTSYSGHASDIGQSHDSYHIAQSNASGDRTVLSPSRGAASETGLDRLGAQRARTTRKHPKQHSRQIPESPLVPDLNTVNTFSRWWESRNMQKAPGQPSAASDSGESFSDRWRRDVASYSTRGHSAVSSPEAPRAVQRVGSMPKVRSTPLQLAEPKSAPKSTAGRRAAPAAHESGDWRAFVHDRATKPSWTDVHAKSYAPPKPADGPFRDSAEGELLRLSWSPALFFAQEGVEPQPSATDVLAPSAMARDVRSVAKSTFVSALDQHKQPRMEAATVPAEGAQNTLATLPWVDAPPAHGVEPPESGESATQGLLARAPLRGPSHTPAKQPAVRNVPRHVQPAPVRTITAPSHVASTLRVDKDLAHRFGAVAFNDPDILDLDPESAPWTMTSEIGHYDRSELHGSDGAEALEAPQPATPSRKMLDRTLRRGPRPTEMGGIAIAHGTLPAPSPHAGSGRIPLRTTSDSIIPPVPVPQNRFVSMPVAERLDDDDASSTETIAFVDALTNGEPGAFDVPDVPDARFGKDARLTLRSTPPATPPRAAPSIGSLSPALDAEDVFLAEDLPSSATHSAFFHFEPRDAAADALAETLQNFPEHLPGKTPTSATVSINRAPAHLRTPHAEDVQLAYLKPATDRSVSEQTTWVRSENAPATPPRSASPRPAAAMRHSPYAPVRTAPWQAHIDPTGAPYDAMPMYAQSERQRPVSAPRPLSGSALAAHEAYMQRYATPRPAVASAQSMAQGRGAVTPGGYPVPTPLRAQPSPGYAAPGHASQVPPVPPVPKAYTAVSEYTSEHPPPPPSKHGHGVEHVQRQEWQAWQEKRERAPESRAQGDGQGYAQESRAQGYGPGYAQESHAQGYGPGHAQSYAQDDGQGYAQGYAQESRAQGYGPGYAQGYARESHAQGYGPGHAQSYAQDDGQGYAQGYAQESRAQGYGPGPPPSPLKATPKRGQGYLGYAQPPPTSQHPNLPTPPSNYPNMDKAMLRATLKRVGYAQESRAQGYGPGHAQSYAQDDGQGYAQGYGPDHAQGYAQESRAQGYGPGHAQSYAQDDGQGYAQGYGPDHAQGYAQESRAQGYGPGYAQGYAQESHAQSYGPGYAQSYAQGYGPGHAQESHAQGYNQGYEQLQPSHAQRYTQPQPSHAQHYAQSYAPTQPVPALTQPVPVQAQGYAPHSPQPVQSAPKPPMHASTPQHPGQHHPGYPPPPGTYQRPQPAMPEPRMPPAPDPMRPAAPKPNAALAMPQAQYAEPVHYPSAQRYASPQPAAPHALPSPPLTQFYAPRSGMLSPPLPTAVSPSPSSTGLSTARSARPKHAPPRAHMVLSPTERDGRAPRTSRPASPSPLDEMPLLGTVPRINSATDIAAMRNRLASPPPAERPLSPSGSVWNDGRSLRHGAPTFHSTHSFADVRGEYTPPDMETQSAASALRQYAGSPLDTREPSLAASTSILNPSTAAAMRKAPLGASTNQYLGLSGTSVPSPPQSLVGGGGGSITSSASRARMSTTDLLRNRPTMVTVNVAGQAPSGSSLRRRLSSTDGGRRRRPLSGAEAADGAAISLSSHTAPPRKISPTQVLVQVMAVAVDNVDRALLREKMQADPTHAFVPGRSFCGRVVECGWDVKRVRKGDIVFGLQDYRKCGALAEFMSIDQDLVAQAPSGPLGIEQVAALPSTGVMVHQIVQNHCMVLRKGARVLILNAHDGIGLLAMQEASRLGLIVIAHVPAHAADGISICEANGAREVVTGEALWAINLLHESSFNLIVDTVGGRHIYDACRRILAHHGQFVTCFGDDQALPTPTYRSHLRSLRRSFFRKDRKGIGYEWIGIDAGPDCRIALESIKVAAQRGAICPRIQSILPFEDAPRAFDHVPSDDPTAGVAVVRVSIAFCMRFQCRGEYGTVRYIGPLPPKEGVWFGVQFDTPGRGKHDGVGPDGVRYFTCPPGNGAFVRDTAPLEFGVLFLDALREKYAEARVPLARLETVSLTGAAPPLDDASCVYVRGAGDAAEIRATCPAIAWLDLSRSLLPDWDALAGITAALPALTTLVLHHTRLAPLQAMPQGLAHLTELKMDAAGVGWESVAHLAHLPALASLQIGYNAIHSVHPLPNDAFPALTTLNLAGNALASWDEIVAALGPLPRLRSMVLSDNRLASLFAPRHAAFAALESVCIDGNPVHAFSSLEALDAMLARPWALGMGRNAGALADRAALRLDVIARLAHLTQLNRTPVHAAERLEAERFYLAHAAPCDARFGALCRAHGAPAAPAPAPTLRAKLVDVGTACVRHMPSQEEACALLQETPRRAKLLRSMPVRLARRRLARAYSVVDTEMPMYAVLRGHAPQEPIVHWMDETQELAWYGLEDGDVIAMVRRE
ncbi:hypothetical protein MVES1_000263 [Malassezia vespertilionis]|uniref:uncharacterized protein n=1 Tax=Malassezia vespertilionis TaxID=2020962 RepID=UPI0024B0EF60|nr:uncharacterized protein MVES1_000263 [Malassezia vespertilionis]WFD04938.1 hypothetical protein MVES1_000263 [Malassezia vespertilionis]